MLELLAEYGLFFAKTITIVVAILIIIGAAFSGAQKQKQDSSSEQLKAKHFNKELHAIKEQLNTLVLDEDERKQILKREKKAEKAKRKLLKKQSRQGENQQAKSRVFVLDFNGDKEGSQVDTFRKEITAVLGIAHAGDELLVRVDSPGGMVHTYGLAASQLERVKKAGLQLTIAVDKVAASGGYLMACMADKLLAAPFAIVGSVGVLVEITNFNRLLKKNDIDVEVLTAGEYKHTLSMLGEITPEAREKTLAELSAVHQMFKDYVLRYRPQINIEQIATGEYWHASQAIELNMVDELMTSDEYLCNKCAEEIDVFEMAYKHKETLGERLGLSFASSTEKFARALLKKLNRPVS